MADGIVAKSRPYVRHQVGKEAEDQALAWCLANLKGRLLARNYRRRVGEIDLVWEEDLPDGTVELVFIEVRARVFRESGVTLVDGLESVDFKKRTRLQRTIRTFLAIDYRGQAESVRMDVLAWDGRAWTHMPNAWSEGSFRE